MKEWYDWVSGDCTDCGENTYNCTCSNLCVIPGGSNLMVCTHRGGHHKFCNGVIYAKGLWQTLPPWMSPPKQSDMCAECGCPWSKHSITSNTCTNCRKCKVYSDVTLTHSGSSRGVPGAAVHNIITFDPFADLHEAEEKEGSVDFGVCECGAAACGIQPFATGHSNWCPVRSK